jgi:hypothetical protein
MATDLTKVLVLLAVACLATAQPIPATPPNVSLPLLKLPQDFTVDLYYKNQVPGLRNLVMSGNSKPGGPIIVYGSTWQRNRVGFSTYYVRSLLTRKTRIRGMPMLGGICYATTSRAFSVYLRYLLGVC